VAFTYDEIFKGIGKAAFLRNVLLFATFLVFVPLIWTFDLLGLEMFSVWMAFNCWMGFRAIRLSSYFKKQYKIK
jgi:MATE family multidrug resistance protein